MFYIGLVLILCGLVFMIAALFRRLEMGLREWILFSAVLIGGLALACVTVEPPESWDLYRHYELLEQMQQGGHRYIFTESIYTHLPVVNLLYALVAWIGVPGLLPCITVIACYGMLSYMLWDFHKKEKISTQTMMLCFLFNLALCPYFHMVSGIRNVLAYAFCAFGVYKEHYDKKKYFSILFSFIAVFIHPSALVILGLCFLLPIFRKWKLLGIVAVLWSLFAEIMTKILLALPNAFLQGIGWKLQDYMGNMEFSNYKILFVKLAFFALLVFLMEAYQKRVSDSQKKYFSLFELTCLVAIGSFQTPFIADRLCFFIAFTAPPVLSMLHRESRGWLRAVYYAAFCVVVVLLFLHQVLYFIKS